MNELLTSFRPRKYQEEIFKKAQTSNVIAALDTGAGKTFISVLLIKWIHVLPVNNGKVTIFIVPKVALVDQQADLIQSQTPLRVKKLRGNAETNLTNRDMLVEIFEQHDVFVMTAQVLLNMIAHSIWTLEKVVLLIFDECHHARKQHPYNSIMHEYFHCPAASRPKVFGMTASPIWNPKDAEGSLATLEKNLDSIVIVVKDAIEELAENSNRPSELLRIYDDETPIPVPYLSYSLWDCVEIFSLSPELSAINFEKLRVRYRVALTNLGPYAADYCLLVDLQSRIKLVTSQATEDASPDLLELHNVIRDFSPFFPPQFDSTQTYLADWLSHKVKALIDILLEFHTADFQGIVFVEQRHITHGLAQLLPLTSELKGIIKCGEIVGHGGMHDPRRNGQGPRAQRDVMKLFRNKEINLLIATAAAEEGLDFPACDVVIRFDALNHLVGYVQSRGRARSKSSTFVVMVGQNDGSSLAKYQSFKDTEPGLKEIYSTRSLPTPAPQADEDDDTAASVHEAFKDTERYVVESTGAVLSYDNCITLLGQLCSTIPRDKYIDQPKPEYTGDFQSTIYLPPMLPLPTSMLKMIGPLKKTKKEAKRAVTFLAVKALHEIKVFNDYLLPSATPAHFKVSVKVEDDQKAQFPKVRFEGGDIMKDVPVCDPWTFGSHFWLHLIVIDGETTAGLVSGSSLPEVQITAHGHDVQLLSHEPLQLTSEEETKLAIYTKMCIRSFITGSPLAAPVALYVVPLLDNNGIDHTGIEEYLAQPEGSPDWSGITTSDHEKVLVLCASQMGRLFLLSRLRPEVSMQSVPEAGSDAYGHESYYAYFMAKQTKKKYTPVIPKTGAIIELRHLPKNRSTLYEFHGAFEPVPGKPRDDTLYNVPRNLCTILPVSLKIMPTFEILLPLLRRISEVYRVHQLRFQIGLSPIQDDLLIEATNLPITGALFNNQRMETLGDSILKLISAVHGFNSNPFHHEGQLTVANHYYVSNTTLWKSATAVGLKHYLSAEKSTIHKWSYCLPNEENDIAVRRYSPKDFPRRSLQDCVESLLAASFLHGGMDTVLRTASALCLNTGGPLPWPLRYSRSPIFAPSPPLLLELQAQLCYEFHDASLLIEAVTHPSFGTAGQSYQRLEFLGDALLDAVVMHYIYQNFPKADSGKLTLAKHRGVCGTVLAALSVKRLNVQKLLLVNNTDLSQAIGQHVSLLEQLSYRDLVNESWKYDPPKALADVFESIIGAVLIDSAYNLELTMAVVENIMREVLQELSPEMSQDPLSDLILWATSSTSCRRLAVKLSTDAKDTQMKASVIVHDLVVVESITGPSPSSARFIAAELARAILSNEDEDLYLLKICDCRLRRRQEIEDKLTTAIEDSLTPLPAEATNELLTSKATHSLLTSSTNSVLIDDSQETLLPGSQGFASQTQPEETQSTCVEA